jgi:hypothetical protein
MCGRVRRRSRRQIDLICIQPSGEITNGAAEQIGGYLKSPQVMPGRWTFLRRGHVSAATTPTKLSMRSDTASRLTAGTVTRDGSLLSVTIS